ncbi:hypothetical protein [Corynebacterium glyciniphilum]|uniref:hypothetical protein n=1 Tax=Corynebacterium glyciniphilum TaxID=1404244 RepID=UPI00264D3A4D|nr:hypothetical protein [Corynebacterium glyciniphilum]MDN6706403.1 hypothetical protein [Corynebacterium glyciniphilum]
MSETKSESLADVAKQPLVITDAGITLDGRQLLVSGDHQIHITQDAGARGLHAVTLTLWTENLTVDIEEPKHCDAIHITEGTHE